MSIENQNIKTKLVKKFIQMSENDFTLKVLKPLFEKMGYHSVDYYGGHSEKGKDLICWKLGDFDEKHLTVVQVKKTKPSASASSEKSFAGIVNQLGQAKEEKVPSLDGVFRVPDSVYFITPYEIDTRALESRIEGVVNQRASGVKVFDGSYVAEQLVRKMPNFVKELLGDELSFSGVNSSILSNIPLLNSLLYKGKKDYKDFFINLDFGVGKISSDMFFKMEFSPVSKNLKLDNDEYEILKRKIVHYENYFDVKCVTPEWDQIEENFKKSNLFWESIENKNKISQLDQHYEELEGLVYGLVDTLPVLLSDLSIRFKIDINDYEMSA